MKHRCYTTAIYALVSVTISSGFALWSYQTVKPLTSHPAFGADVSGLIALVVFTTSISFFWHLYRCFN